MVNNTMDALEWLRKQLDGDGDDLVREMVREFAQRLMAAEVDVLAGAGWGEVSPTPRPGPNSSGWHRHRGRASRRSTGSPRTATGGSC